MVVYPIIHEMVGHPGSLYFTRMGPDSNSLMFDARKTFLGIFVSFSWPTCLLKIWYMLGLAEWHHELAYLSGTN